MRDAPPDLSPADVSEPLVQEPDARPEHVPEAVLQDMWATQRFDAAGLRTTEGELVAVLSPGRLNHDGGPDFSEARLRVGGADDAPALLLVGDVEVHRNSAEWLLHRHHEDPRYNRVALHVALVSDEHTGRLRRADGTLLPEVVLAPRLGESLRRLLHRFYALPRPGFACASLWDGVPDETKRSWVRRLGAERLRRKAARLAEAYGRAPDLDGLLYHAVFRALGYRPNADAMAELARRVPPTLARRLHEPVDLEALLLGVAGLLPDPAALRQTAPLAAAYADDLQARLGRLLAGTPVQSMPAVQWLFARLRPANFPTRRIAQAAALLAPSSDDGRPGLLRHDALGRLREALRAGHPVRALRDLFQTPRPSAFWEAHVRFAEPANVGAAGIGRERADVLIADAALPVLLLDAEQRGDHDQGARVLAALGRLPAASDGVTRLYEAAGLIPADAVEAQGLHGLHRDYCAAGRCLACEIGQQLLGRSAA